MFPLSELKSRFPQLRFENFNEDISVASIGHDHREVNADDIFAALPGLLRHGAEFTKAAFANHVAAVLTDEAGFALNPDLPTIVSAEPRKDMGLIAAFLSGDAQSKLLKIAVTGTNGKTTTSFMIYSMLSTLNLHPTLIGTTGIRIGLQEFAAKRTTPESTDLHRTLESAVKQESKSLVMEVSSHALALHRVAGMHYDVAIFTGLTQDHLDFHGTMENYFLAKAKLFEAELTDFAIICVDDEWGVRLTEMVKIPFVTYSSINAADWSASNVELQADGKTKFTASGPSAAFGVELAMPGQFNIANALGSIAALNSQQLNPANFVSALKTVEVPGRLQRIECGQPFVVLVDYAHSPDAVAKALEVARQCAGDNRVIAVLGCGGDRDAAKRPLMGDAAAHGSDVVVITDDNPRSESPQEIRAQIINGVSLGTQTDLHEIADRKEAIDYAIQNARSGDCVIILGKGHEEGQEIAGEVFPFSDSVAATQSLEQRND
jgi:UDP-N-acetylmuramoyl-L-alanyl-D-glutamate--2,6-diaminopimelate ligase